MNPAVLRDDMVDGLEHDTKGVIRSEAVSVAMRTVPRHTFIEDERAAYADRTHRVDGSTAFAPRTVARLVEALRPEPGHRTLNIGAGVGYTVAVLAEIVGGRDVHAIELSHQLVHRARDNLQRAGYPEVLVARGDGACGLPSYGPYDRILVETAAVRPPHALSDQLTEDGRMVIPLGSCVQELTVIEDSTVVERCGTLAVDPMLVPGEEPGAIERNRMSREDRELAARAAERRLGWERDWIDWDGR